MLIYFMYSSLFIPYTLALRYISRAITLIQIKDDVVDFDALLRTESVKKSDIVSFIVKIHKSFKFNLGHG